MPSEDLNLKNNFHLLFPGQGSQHPGMGKFLYDQFPAAQQTFQEANDILKKDIEQLCFSGTEAELALTENTQPCVLTVSTATIRVLLSEFGVIPVAASGHSLGEYSAVVAAGGISFSDALLAVQSRAQAMQAAVPVGEGGMIAVQGLSPNEASQLCDWAVQNSQSGPLTPANFNAPGLILLSGNKKTIDWLGGNLNPKKMFPDNKNVKLMRVNVSAPFHCEMMRPAEIAMREVLTKIDFKQTNFPVLQNFTARGHRSAEEIRENLIRQISAPVRWTESMGVAKENSWFSCIECGANNHLRYLLNKIGRSRFEVFTTTSIQDLYQIEKSIRKSELPI